MAVVLIPFELSPFSVGYCLCRHSAEIYIEANAIKSLQNDHTIIIKEADKGGATVIMDRKHYLEMVETTLNDKEYYEILTKDPHKETKLKYNKFLKKHES